MLEAARNYLNWLDKIKIPKKAIACRIKSPILIENINVQKLRFTKTTSIKFGQICLA